MKICIVRDVHNNDIKPSHIKKVRDDLKNKGNSITTVLNRADALVIIRSLNEEYFEEQCLYVSIGQLGIIPKECLMEMEKRGKLTFIAYIDLNTKSMQFRMTNISNSTVTASYAGSAYDLLSSEVKKQSIQTTNQYWYL